MRKRDNHSGAIGRMRGESSCESAGATYSESLPLLPRRAPPVWLLAREYDADSGSPTLVAIPSCE